MKASRVDPADTCLVPQELQYEAELVLATLMESQVGQLQQDAARVSPS